MAQKKEGFSLIEILIGLVVFGFAMTAASSIFYKVSRDWRKQTRYIECQENLRWALEYMSREIRMASVSDLDDPGNGNNNGVGCAYGHFKKLDFLIDPDGDGVDPIRVQYERDEANYTITRRWKPSSGGWSAQQVLAGNIVDNPDLQCDSDLNCHASLWNIFSVPHAYAAPPCDAHDPFFNATNGYLRIMLTTRPFPAQPAGPDNYDFTLETSIKARND
ncbi:MAG: prepilin-type N-terminal cleavage/methylation domain-containing protein [Candidatus Omnitrophota bacterium]